MASTISPNMSLTIPTVGQQPGPDYAYNVNTSLTLIDQHDHTPGRGVQITPAALNIDADLDMQSNSLINVNNVAFSVQASSSIIQSLYVAPGSESTPINDLWYNDGNGNAIQLTSNGLVNATLASLPGESYAAGTFFWRQGTGSTVPANFDIGSITIRPNIAATTYGVTISPPASIASQYTVYMPLVPVATKIMTIDAAGQMLSVLDVDNSTLEIVTNVLRVKDLGITTAKLANLAVTTAKIDNQAVTASKIAPDIQFTDSQEFVDVTPSFTVKVATTVDGNLATAFVSGSNIDGTGLATSDLILIKNQTNAADNGVYVVQNSGNPVRDVSYDTFAELNYAAVTVSVGTANAGTNWYQQAVLTSLADSQVWTKSSVEAFVVPTGVTHMSFVGAGGGGGGGGGGGNNASNVPGGGGGGGSGGVIDTIAIPVTPGETLSIILGAGGTGGAGATSTANSAGGTGASGSDSKVISTARTLTFAGGVGGGGSVTANGATRNNGVAGTNSILYAGLGGVGGTATVSANGGGGGAGGVGSGGSGGGTSDGQSGGAGRGFSAGGGGGATGSAGTGAGDGGAGAVSQYAALTAAGGIGGGGVSLVTQAAGGGGGGSSFAIGGAGGAGANSAVSANGVAAAANSGGGGGGGGGRAGNGAAGSGGGGANGGSGKIIAFWITSAP